jgi:hypothetical protein
MPLIICKIIPFNIKMFYSLITELSLKYSKLQQNNVNFNNLTDNREVIYSVAGDRKST